MKIKDNIVTASEGKYLARKIEPENYFRACSLLEGEGASDFIELTQEQVDEIEAKRMEGMPYAEG